MARHTMNTGFLTKEERIVFLTVSLCLLGGGLYLLIDSVLELPQELTMPESASEASVHEVAGGGGQGTDGSIDQSEEEAPGLGFDHTRARPGTAAGGKTAEPSAAQILSAKLDLNRANGAELEALPGIGPALVARIIQTRESMGGFGSVEDLLEVRGIGPKTLSRFREWVFVSSSK